MPNVHLIVDIASAPIEGVEAYVEPATAPKNYTDPVKIAAAVAEKTAERIAAAGLDLDLARLTGVGILRSEQDHTITLCMNEDHEREALVALAAHLAAGPSVRLVTYNGHDFDLPLLMRRARYLGVPFPKINLDRYRSPHTDLMLDLTDRNPQRRRPLGFYVRRHGWADLVKPLDGAEEARVHETGLWMNLEESIRHDLIATYRLGQWLGALL